MESHKPLDTLSLRIDREIQTDVALNVCRRLDLDNTDCMSTPPSELRREIYYLRKELIETQEFHDLEYQVLKEDNNFENSDAKNYKLLELEKSLKDAEKNFSDINNKFLDLKNINIDLNKKLKDESNQKEQLEDQITKLQHSMKKTESEVEILKRDKNDYEYKIEILNENYNRRISELKLALEKANEKESESVRTASYDELERRLAEENEKTKALSAKLDELDSKLFQNREKIKSHEQGVNHTAEDGCLETKSCKSVRNVTIQTDECLARDCANGNHDAEITSGADAVSHTPKEESIKSVTQLSPQKNLPVANVNLSVAQESKSSDEIVAQRSHQPSSSAYGEETEFIHPEPVRSSTDVVTQTDEEVQIADSNSETHSSTDCASFEMHIKALKDKHDNKLKELELVIDNLKQTNSKLNENLQLANETLSKLMHEQVADETDVKRLTNSDETTSCDSSQSASTMVPAANESQPESHILFATEFVNHTCESDVKHNERGMIQRDEGIHDEKHFKVDRESQTSFELQSSEENKKELDDKGSQTSFELQSSEENKKELDDKESQTSFELQSSEENKKELDDKGSQTSFELPSLEENKKELDDKESQTSFELQSSEENKKELDDKESQTSFELQSLEENEKELDDKESQTSFELQSSEENKKELDDKESQTSDDLESLEKIKKELRDNLEWERKLSELKTEKEYIIEEREEKIRMILVELEQAREKLKENELKLTSYIQDKENCIEILTSEVLECQNWIKLKEKQFCDLNVTVENEIFKIQNESEQNTEQLKTFYEDKINNLLRNNESLQVKIDAIKEMYDSELTKVVKFVEEERMKIRADSRLFLQSVDTIVGDGSDRSKSDDTLNGRLSPEGNIKPKSEIEVNDDEDYDEALNTQLNDLDSMFLVENVPLKNSCIDYSNLGKDAQEEAVEDMSLLKFTEPRDESEFLYNHRINSLEENDMERKFKSEFEPNEFVNEFIRILLQENIVNEDEVKSGSNIFYTLLNKHRHLMEMYSNLKTNFRDYLMSEDKKCYEIMNKTFNYLDNLCTQIDESEGTLNISNPSFVSFHDSLPSSTIIHEQSEPEISAINNDTSLATDPLAITQNLTLQTPLKSCKKIPQNDFKTPLKYISKSPFKTPKCVSIASTKKRAMQKPNVSNCERESSKMELSSKCNAGPQLSQEVRALEIEYDKRICDCRDTIDKTLKSFVLLEERIVKLESVSLAFETEKEKLITENERLRESASEKSAEIRYIKEKLIMETVHLQPDLKDSLTDDSVSNILTLFMSIIMKSCEEVRERLTENLMLDITKLRKEIQEYVMKVLDITMEMEKLKNLNEMLVKDRDEREKTVSEYNDEIQKLKERMRDADCLQLNIEALEEKLKERDNIIKSETSSREECLRNLEELMSLMENIKNDNETLREKIEEYEKNVMDLETKLHVAEEANDILQMKGKEQITEIEELKSTLVTMEKGNADLGNIIDGLKIEIDSLRKTHSDKDSEIKELNVKISESDKVLCEREKTILDLNENILAFQMKGKEQITEIEELKSTLVTMEKGNADLGNIIDGLKIEIDSLRKTHSDKDSEIEELNVKISESDKVLCEREKTILDLNENILAVEGKFNLEILNVARLRDEVEQLNQCIALTNDKNENLEMEISTLRSHIETTEVASNRKLEELQNFSDLLRGTLRKVINALNVPIDDYSISDENWEEYEDRVLKYISEQKMIRGNSSNGDESYETAENLSICDEVELTPERFEELGRTVSELQTAMDNIIQHLGLPEGISSGSQEVTHRIVSMIDDVRKDFQNRIDILRQDNQHLDDDNNILQEGMKQLIEQNNLMQLKLKEFEESKEMLNIENVPRLEPRSKTTRRSDIYNRRLDKLEELNQNLVELLCKMLSLIGIQNVQEYNLFAVRTFESESKEIYNNFVAWVNSKSSEIQKLKTSLQELDEECESYAKDIKEAKKETVKVWQEGRNEVEMMKAQMDEMLTENKSFRMRNEELSEKISVLQANNSNKDTGELCQCEEYRKQINHLSQSIAAKDLESERLIEKCNALEDEMKKMEEINAESRKQIEELDEECDSYAKVIKESRKEMVKVWEEGKNEIESMKAQIEELQMQKKCVESEKNELLEKISILETAQQPKKLCSEMNDEPIDFSPSWRESEVIKELRSKIHLREMQFLDLEQSFVKQNMNKSQLKYLEDSLSTSNKLLADEKEKNTLLQMQLNEVTKNQTKKVLDPNDVLGKLNMLDSFSEDSGRKIDEREKLCKSERDNKILRDLCRTQYTEIRRLQKEHSLLKGRERTTKNSNQMDSPIRTRCPDTRSKK